MSPTPQSPAPEKGNRNLWLAAVVLLTLVCYGVTLRFGYVYDDVMQVQNNPRIQEARFLPSYFTQQVWAQMPGQPENLYRPLFLAWLLGNYEAFGLSAAGWHFSTILMHVLATVLVFVLGRKLLPDHPYAAVIAAAIFAVHPSHVEAVAWISGVTEPLCSVFFLAAFLSYLEYRERTQRSAWLAASCALYVCAMLAKESAIVLPGVIAAYELCFPRRPEPASSSATSTQAWGARLRRLAILLVPYAGVCAGYLALRSGVLRGFAHRVSDVPMRTAVFTLPNILYFYVSQLLAPMGLGPFYDVFYANGWSVPNLFVPVVVLAIVAFGLWWWSRKTELNLPLFLGTWLVLTLAPALAVSLVMSRYEAVHDRYVYLPSVAMAILMGYGWCALFPKTGSRKRRTVELGVAALLIGILGLATYRQCLYWQNDEALFARGFLVAPRNILAKLNFSSEMVKQRRFEAAFMASQQAVELDPNSAPALSSAGEDAYYLGDYARAEGYYIRALAIGPPHVDQFYYLALTRIATGHYPEALQVLEEGQRLFPDSPGYHSAMARAYAGLSEWNAAVNQYEKELQFYPGSPGAADGLANAKAHLDSGSANRDLDSKSAADLRPVSR